MARQTRGEVVQLRLAPRIGVGAHRRCGSTAAFVSMCYFHLPRTHYGINSPVSHAEANTASNAANNVSNGITGGKSGVIPIAPGPPKPQAAPSANSAPNRGVNVAPKRPRRQSKAGMQELEMVDADDTSGKAPALPTTRKKDLPLVPTNLSNQNLGSLPMGAMGQGLVTGVSGPQEWEWLTMSL